MNPLKKFFYALRLREAMRKAEEAFALTGNRQYVMPIAGSGGRLIIVDRKNFRTFRLKHYISPHARVADLVRECFYCTAYPDGGGYLAPDDARRKRLQYFLWLEAERRLKREKKKKKKDGK